MATIAFPDISKTAILPSGVTYTYVSIPAKPTKPTILFLHGCPSSSYDWRHQISFFSAHGYGVLAPDLLGYGGTTKPSSLHDYRGKKMALELAELLDHENITAKVHAIGHDFGALPCSKLLNYVPARVTSAVFMCAPYIPPGMTAMDVDAMEKMTKEMLGYEVFGYWRFFVKPTTGKLLIEHFDSWFSLVYPADPGIWKDHLVPSGALEAWVTGDRQAPPAPYVTEEEKAMHKKIFHDGYDGALDWYRAGTQRVNDEDEQEVGLDPNVRVPVLSILAKKDVVVAPGTDQMMKMLIPELETVEVDSGHWVQLDKRDEFNEIVKGWVDRYDSRE